MHLHGSSDRTLPGLGVWHLFFSDRLFAFGNYFSLLLSGDAFLKE
jgi:hypothetical protein